MPDPESHLGGEAGAGHPPNGEAILFAANLAPGYVSSGERLAGNSHGEPFPSEGVWEWPGSIVTISTRKPR